MLVKNAWEWQMCCDGEERQKLEKLVWASCVILEHPGDFILLRGHVTALTFAWLASLILLQDRLALIFTDSLWPHKLLVRIF